jgi:hypothetical protein
MEDLDIYTLLFLINIMSILVHMIKTCHINDINLLKNVIILAKIKEEKAFIYLSSFSYAFETGAPHWYRVFPLRQSSLQRVH